MKIKLDENISRHLKPHLQKAGYDTFTAADEELLGKPDVEVGTAARSEGRILFTLDLEFADLRKFPPGTYPGIILFRPQSLGPLATNRFILNFLKETDLAALSECTVIVDPTRVRITTSPSRYRYPRIGRYTRMIFSFVGDGTWVLKQFTLLSPPQEQVCFPSRVQVDLFVSVPPPANLSSLEQSVLGVSM